MTAMVSHGTHTQYAQHGCRCVLCRRAASRARTLWRLRVEENGGELLSVPATGTLRRLQALAAIGWSTRAVAERAGVSPGSLRTFLYAPSKRVLPARAEAVATVYEELCMTLGPSKTSIAAARKRGWAPPLAWDDIDHDEAPQGVALQRRNSLRREQRLDEITDLLDAGETPVEIAARYGVQPRALANQAYRAGRHDLGRRLNRKEVAA